MVFQETKISLPKAVSYRWQERLEWFENDQEGYDLSDEDMTLCRRLIKLPVKVMKTRDVYTVPYYGQDHRMTWIASNALEMTIYDAYVLKGDITASHESKLQIMRRRWVENGEFKMPPAIPKAPLRPEVIEHRARVEKALYDCVDTAFETLKGPDSPVTLRVGFKRNFVIKTSWSPGRYRSNGGFQKGVASISLHLKHRFDLSANKSDLGCVVFKEYAQIRNSPVIGSCYGPWHVVLAALVAHEVAHAVQYALIGKWHCSSKDLGNKLLSAPHGEGWQEIYRYLRENWVNKMESYQNI